ncbi:MAG: sulfite exporter TauE/SafE family protein [Nitrospirales bacterium]
MSEPLTYLQFGLALLSGGLVGLLLGATGGGGSLIAIPLLVYVVGLPVQKATALSLIVVGCSALFGAWKESRHQHVHLLAAVLFSFTGMIGAWVGAHGHQLVPESVVLFLFGNLLLVISLWTFWHQQGSPSTFSAVGCAQHFTWKCAFKALAIGWGVGLLTGFFGIGGGFLIVPTLMFLLEFPIRVAIGTSFLIISLISLGGVIGHLNMAHLHILITGLLLAGSFLGLWFGSHLTRKVSTAHLRKGVAAVIGLVGLGLLLDNGLALLG